MSKDYYCRNCSKRLLEGIDYIMKELCVRCYDRWEEFQNSFGRKDKDEEVQEDSKD
jgi:hypothetical protein